MSIQNPPLFADGESHPAEDVRRWIEAMSGDRTAIVDSADFTVAQQVTPTMSVSVAAGRALVRGTQATYQGAYFVENRGSASLSIATADATNDRRDLVVLQVEDGSYPPGATSAASLAVVTGTPGASPALPAAPANSITLAEISVAAGATSITDANITDLRPKALAAGLGGVIPCPSTARPTSPRVGTAIFETDALKLRVWNGTSWVEYAPTSTVATAVPAGTVAMYAPGGFIPSGWLALDGTTIFNADTVYPELWAVADSSWKSGTSLTLPNMKGRVPVHLDTSQGEFSSLGATGGSKTRTLTKANLPTHTHTINHDHASATSGSSGGHSHSVTGTAATAGSHSHSLVGTYVRQFGAGALGLVDANVYAGVLGNPLNLTANPGTDSDGSHSHSVSGTAATVAPHTHSVNLPAYSGNSGNGSPDGLTASAFQVLQPYFVLRFMIKT